MSGAHFDLDYNVRLFDGDLFEKAIKNKDLDLVKELLNKQQMVELFRGNPDDFLKLAAAFSSLKLFQYLNRLVAMFYTEKMRAAQSELNCVAST